MTKQQLDIANHLRHALDYLCLASTPYRYCETHLNYLANFGSDYDISTAIAATLIILEILG